jgi:DNA-binding IclR family transcriptional regulator
MADADPALSSPPVVRTVAILNFLAGHPDQAFTLAELTRSLKLSSATAHSVLGALCEAGYVYRTAAKTYVLGPTLSRIGRAALAPSQVMNVTRPEMRLLADEFDVICSATVRQGDEAMIFERATAVSHVGWHSPQPLRVPLATPLGGLFHAWDAPALNAWLDATKPPLAAQARERLVQAAGFLRTHGFSAAERKLPLADPEAAREMLNRADLTDFAVAELDPDRRYNLAYVVAPVIAQPGTITFLLSLAGFVAPVSGAEVARIGSRLRAACDRIGRFIAERKFDATF